MAEHILAYLNAEFLESEEARAIRILAEYFEPLRRFKAQNIQDTVVFFGSARIRSREKADEALARLEGQLLQRTKRTGKAEGRQGGGAAQPRAAHRAHPRPPRGDDVALLRGRAQAGAPADRVEPLARLPAQPLRGLLGRRSRHHGGGQPRRHRGRRQEHGPQHQAAVRAGPQRLHHRRASASSSTTSSCASSGSPTSPRRW